MAGTSRTALPSDANLWLSLHNWQRLNPHNNIGALWQRGLNQVLVPLQPDAVDFWRRWEDMIVTLSEAHQLSPEAISDDFLFHGSDVSEWSADDDDMIDNTIPVSALHTLTGTVKSSIIAAANATLSPRGYFGHSIPLQAREAAAHARAGQPRRGSYVIPVISHLPLEGQDRTAMLDLDVALQPYPRQVLGTLASALGMIHEVAVLPGKPPSRSILNEVVREGVSHELCAALADSLASPSIGEISVSFRWAKAVPWQRSDAEVVFPRDAYELVHGMATDLKNSPVIGEQRLVGYVRHLDRGEDDEQGRVTLRTPLGGIQRSVRLYLPDGWYQVAGQANLDRRSVYVRGVLERTSGRMWEFMRIEDFGIIENLGIDELERLLPTIAPHALLERPE